MLFLDGLFLNVVFGSQQHWEGSTGAPGLTMGNPLQIQNIPSEKCI